MLQPVSSYIATTCVRSVSQVSPLEPNAAKPADEKWQSQYDIPQKKRPLRKKNWPRCSGARLCLVLGILSDIC